MCFNARTEAQGTRGEGAFSFRLIAHFCTETGTDETNEYGVELGGLFFAETGMGAAKDSGVKGIVGICLKRTGDL